jgi:hypothetical protein
LAGKTWRSYQEDIDLTPVGGQPANTGGQIKQCRPAEEPVDGAADELLRKLCLGLQSVQRLDAVQLCSEP